MNQHKRRQLPQLSKPKTRLVLIAGSYLDAVETTRRQRLESLSTRSAGGLDPLRNMDLWPRGSYREFEHACDELLIHCRSVDKHRCWHRYMWEIFVHDAHHGIRQSYTPLRFAQAYAGLRFVLALMPKEIHVPVDVTIRAGYLRSSALLAATQRERVEERKAA